MDKWLSLITAFVIIFAGFLFAIVLASFLWFTIYAVALERKGPIDGAKTSLQFMRSNMLEVTIFSLLLFGIGLGVGIVSIIISLPFMLFPIVGELVSTAIQLGISLLVGPWITMSFVVFYLNITGKMPSSLKSRPTP
jgi:hypothetical protein